MTTEFTGAFDNDANNVLNWDNGLPDNANAALISTGKTAVMSSDLVDILGLTIDGGGTLTTSGFDLDANGNGIFLTGAGTQLDATGSDVTSGNLIRATAGAVITGGNLTDANFLGCDGVDSQLDGCNIVASGFINLHSGASMTSCTGTPNCTLGAGDPDGGPVTVDSCTMTLSNFNVADGSTVNGCAITCTGGSAHDSTFTGTEIFKAEPYDASDNCVDNGGNVNIQFVASAEITWDGSDSENPGNAANWTPEQVPTQIDDIIVNGDAPGNITGDDLIYKNADFTGFVGSYAGDYYSYGDTLLSAGMTHASPNQALFQNASGSIHAFGQHLNEIDIGVGTLTLLSDIDGHFIDVNAGTTLVQNGFDILITIPAGDEDGIYIVAAADYTYTPGDLLTYDLQAADSYGDIQFDGVTGPSVVVAGGGFLYPYSTALVLQSINVDGETTGGMYFDTVQSLTTLDDMTFTDSKLTADGSTDDLNGCALICPGNFTSTNSNLKNGTLNASGTAVAVGCVITDFDASGGTELDATSGCTDGGGNTNVNFGSGTPGLWDGETDESTTEATNWDDDLIPDATVDVTVNGDAPANVVGNIVGKNFDFTGFAALFDGSIQAHGNVVFDAGMTVGEFQNLRFDSDGSYTPNGIKFYGLETLSGADVILTMNATLVGSATLNADLTFGANTLRFEVAEGEQEGLNCAAGSSLTWSTGAKIEIDGTGGVDTYATFYVNEPTIITPPVYVTGGLTLYPQFSIVVQSLSVIGSWIDFSSGGLSSITAVEGITVTDGFFTTDEETPDGMNGKSLIAGGDLDIDNTQGITNGNLDVTGTATIHNSTISNMTSTGPVDCTDNCVDGGGNDGNFNFGVVANQAPVADAGADQILNTLDPIQLDGSATDDGLPEDPGALTYLWTQVSGPAVTFTDDTDPQTTAIPSAQGVIVLDLETSDGELTDNDQVTITIDLDAATIDSLATNHATGDFTTGEVINIQATGSEALFVTGTPQLPIVNHNGQPRLVNYLSGSGTTVLVFRLTALSSDQWNALRVAAGSSINLNGGTIKDGAGNDAILTLPALSAAVAVGHSSAYQPPAHNRRLGMIR